MEVVTVIELEPRPENEVDSCSSSSVDLTDSFKIPQTSQSWRSHSCSELSSSLQNKIHCQKIRKRRKPVMMKFRSASKNNTYDHHAPFNTHNAPAHTTTEDQKPLLSTKFQKREITTIHEEVYHIPLSDRELRMHSYCRKRYSKRKDHKEKVASLKVIVARLTKMCVEKPEMLQDTLPDETIKLFKSIHI